MQYRGFEVRENTKRGIWQAIRLTALHWEDGLSAPDKATLKNQMDCWHDGARANPWQLPSDAAIESLMTQIAIATGKIAADDPIALGYIAADVLVAEHNASKIPAAAH
jgi:hypothetical protein